MILKIKTCADCPLANNDNEYGMDGCNLSLKLGNEIKLGTWEQLPSDKRHKDCPIENFELELN